MNKMYTCVFFLLTFYASAQTSAPLATGHYIVVATYRPGQEALAKKYTDELNKSGTHAKFGYDTPHHYLYVYLDHYADFSESIREMLKTRKANGFEQAWVRVIKNGIAPEELVAQPDKSVEQIEKAALPVVQKDGTNIVKPAQPAVAPPKPFEPIMAQTKTPEPVVAPSTPPVVSSGIVEVKEPEEPKKVVAPKAPMSLANTKVYMHFVNPTNNKDVDGGEIEFVDGERSRLISTAKGNTDVLIPDPKSTSGKMTVIGNTFGYRKVQHEINYKLIPSDTSLLITPYKDGYKMEFDMVRYHKGDTEVLYDVFFYNDAAIMLPESKYQLNQLLQMMKENPEYKILLHGHTNGNAHGRIITMGPSKNFFALSDDVKEGIGSAKSLSGKRAEVIREWLIANGVPADHIQAKAWGGSRMLHDKNSVNAKKNVRVEVEVLED